jgi:hypothetical protein
MKKRWIWLALLIITSFGVVLGWNWERFQASPQGIEASFQHSSRLSDGHNRPTTSLKAQEPPPDAPTVNADRLMTDLTALSFIRYLDADRDRARHYILDALEAAGWQPQLQAFENGENIIAERPGTDPDADVILLGAHYDSVERSPGADDNATAVAATLETARLLGTLPTSHTLRLAFFDLEEAGLLGSVAYVNQPSHRQHLQGAIILEMLGYRCQTENCQQYPPVLPIAPPTTRGDFLAVIGDQGHPELLNSFVQASRTNLPQVLTLPVPLLGPFTPDLLRSDHAAFWRKGVGAVMVTDTANFRNPNYHQPTDTPDTLNPAFFVGSVQLVVNAVTDLLSN